MTGVDPLPAASASARPPGTGHWSALTIGAGVLTTVIGVLILVWPDATIVVIAWLFAVQLLVTGALQLVAAFRGDGSTGGRVLPAVLGALSILVGLLCLRVPLQTALVIGLLIGATWVATGIIGIVHALGATHDEGRGWGVAAGALSVLAGAVVLVNPGLSLTALVWIFGLVLTLTGLAAVLGGVVARRQARSRAGGATGRTAPAPG